MRRFGACAAVLLLAGCASTAALEAELRAAPAVKGRPWENFIRIRGRRVEGEPPWLWSIATSVRTLQQRGTGSRILLCSMHHAGSPAYYRAVEERLRSADLVLDEGVDPEGKVEQDATEDVRTFHSLQVELCRTLKLQKQSEWERAARDARWFAADVTLDELQILLDLTRTALSPEGVAATRESLGGRDGEARGQTFVLRAVASLSEDGTTAIEAIQALRDARAFAAVKARMSPGRTLAVVYGALHTRKLESRFLDELGFEIEGTEWLEVASFRYDPGFADGLELRGWLRHREGDLEGARSDFERGLALEPRNPRALLAQARVLIALDRPGEAVPLLSRALEIDPQLTPALVQRGLARGNAGDVAGALEDLNGALERIPADPEAHYARGMQHYRRGELDLALRDLDATLRTLSAHPNPFLFRGHIHARAGRPEEAIRDYSEVLKLQPGHVEALYGRAALRARAGDFDRALVDLNRLLEVSPEHRDGRHMRAVIRFERRAYAEVMADCDVLLAKEPAYPPALQIRAKARWESGRFLAALADYEALAAGGSWTPEAWIWIARMRRIHGAAPEDFGRALAKARELRPSDPDLFLLSGDVAYDDGRWEAAELDYRRAAAQPRVSQGRALLRLWLLAARAGSSEQAGAELRAWLRNDPADQAAARTAEFLLGDRTEAAYLEDVPSCDGLFHAGSRRLLAGDLAGARAVFARHREHALCDTAGHLACAAALRRLD